MQIENDLNKKLEFEKKKLTEDHESKLKYLIYLNRAFCSLVSWLSLCCLSELASKLDRDLNRERQSHVSMNEEIFRELKNNFEIEKQNKERQYVEEIEKLTNSYGKLKTDFNAKEFDMKVDLCCR